MTLAAVAIVVEGVLLALALLFVVALLRSHAAILRRLGAIERELDVPVGPPSGRPAPGARPGGLGHAAAAPVAGIAGESLAGDAVKIALGAGAPPTLLAFLSSGCAACGPLWAGLHERLPLPFEARLVVVTKGPDRERLARLLELAPSEAEVVMSTAAWEAFAIPATPHFVLVRDQGIAGRGSATSWQQIATLLRDAREDGELHRARTTAERAARAEQALASAGITAGHSSLYPSRQPPEMP